VKKLMECGMEVKFVREGSLIEESVLSRIKKRVVVQG
jgi:hypothetical protein